MKEQTGVYLSNGMFVLVDAEDIPTISGKRWRAMKSRHTFYAARTERVQGRKTTVYMHRVIANPLPGMFVDHKDSNGLNNRRANLRNATPSQNAANSKVRKHNSVGWKGVEKKRNRFQARIRFGNIRISLGCFSTPEDAHAAYCKAAAKLHGEFAREG